MQRRTYLTALGLAAGTAFAGCSGGTGGNNSSGGSENNGSGGGSTPQNNNTGGNGGGTATSGGGTATSGGGGEMSPTEGGGETAASGTSDGAQATTAAESTQPRPTSARKPSPTATGGVGGTPMSTATTGGGGSSAVSITSSELSKKTEYGFTDAAMVGKLTAPTHLQSIELRATFRNDAGDILDTEPGYFQGLDEGQTWNFYIAYLGQNPPADGSVEVVSTIPGSAPSSPPAKVVESNLNPSPDQYTGPTVTGRAKNTGSSTLPYLEARVKFLTDDGTALDSDFTNITNLPAGETWSFKVEQITFSTDPRPETADYEVTLAT